MARRKRKDETPIWEPPEFDEVGYMRKEIENAKIALVVIAWAVVGAILTFLFYAFNQPVIGFLIGIFAFGVLYFLLPMLGLPIHGFKRRDWLSHASVYFFSWLAFSILLLNAPFGDHTNPVVGSFQVGSFTGNGTSPSPLPGNMWCIPASPGQFVNVPAHSNKSMYVIFRATDNIEVRNVTVSVDGSPATYVSLAGKANYCIGSALPPFPPNTYGLSIPIGGSTNTHPVIVTAVDTSGLSATESITVAPA